MINEFTDKLKTYSIDRKIELKDSSFLLSFSGGMDSTSMASLLLKIRDKYIMKIGFAHFNHHSHSMSNEIEEFCFQYSQHNNVHFYLNDLFFDTKRNFEARAREKRYKILRDIAKKYKYSFILTAHHQDDQLETLYMKKMDGSDRISQIGIREKMEKLRRPFLDISKKKIKGYARKHNISWIEDPTNTNMNIRRNKIRHKLLPEAFQEDSALKESLLATAQKNVIWMEKTALKLKQDKDNIIVTHSLNTLELNRKILQTYKLEELKLFICHSMLSLLKVKLNLQSGGLWREFRDFIKKSNSGAIFLIDGLTFIINRNKIIAINKYDNFISSERLRLCNNLLWHLGQFKINKKRSVKLSSSKNHFFVPDYLYKKGLYIRPWKHGDRIISATSNKHVSLSDLYINNKLSKYEKLIQPVVVDGNGFIYWVPGIMHGKINYDYKDKFKAINWIKR